VRNDTDRMAGEVRCAGGGNRLTGGMRILQYVVGALLVVALAVTSIGWYLSAHPGGVRFESCHWEGSHLVLGYTYGSGDTVSTMVHPDGDHADNAHSEASNRDAPQRHRSVEQRRRPVQASRWR